MSALDQVFQNSPASTTVDMDKDTQMTVISPIANHEDIEEGTPEPNSPKHGDEDIEEEEKDPLYNALAPKQNIGQQLKSVVDSVPDQNKMINNDELPPAYSESHNYDYLKSTLKKQQRSWVDPWEAAVQDTFYHKEITDLRPTFEIVNGGINGVESLRNLFENNQATINEDNEYDDDNPDDLELEAEEKQMAKESGGKKFGPWDGVMAGCLLNIFGVIMFLRVGFVVGQAGIIQALLIMCISTVVTVTTALSMSAICTNGTILAGGAYYIISRALGPSIGGAIGILFSVGNMAACSLYLIGFAETLVANLSEQAGFNIFDDPVMDVRIWSNVVLVFVLILAIVGLKYVIKAQLGLLVFIVCAISLFFIGSTYKTYENTEYPNPDYVPSIVANLTTNLTDSMTADSVFNTTDDWFDFSTTEMETTASDNAQFITVETISPQGWTNGNFVENLGSGYDGYDFFGVLAIFFPAVTGIMAGANISGDLRNPSSDIPKGTLTAIGISATVYALMAIFVGAVTVRYELITNDLVMSYICVWEYIVLIGIYAATLSSAIASLVGAPRVLQAVANDNLFPFKVLTYFAKSDKDGNPIRGYFLSFGVAFCCNLIGELNAIAPLISQFFMLTYLLINASCFALEISKSPGWRPSFKYFNKWTAFLGAFLCLVIMFLLNWVYALVACMIVISLYSYVEWKDPEVNWGAAPQARKYYSAYKAILKLRKTKSHIKNWRPGLLVLVRDPIKRAQMMLFAQTLKKAHGPVFYATVHTGDYRTNIRKFHEAHSLGYLPLNAPKHSKGFYESVLADSLRSGVQNLFQLVGMGSLRPNTLVIGYKRKWRTDSDEIITEYVQILRDTLVMGMGLMISVGFKRVNWFLEEYAPPALQHDVDDYAEIYAGGLTNKKPKNKHQTADMHDDEAPTVDHEGGGGMSAKGRVNNMGYQAVNMTMSMPRNQEEEEQAIKMASAWEGGQGKDTVIDVWWMIDDGGLCMLIPYIMKLHKFWARCKLRMLLVSEDETIQSDVATMKSLIDNFRLPYKGPLLVPAKKAPHQRTVEKFESLAKCKISDCPRPSVIKKWLILSELLFEYSRYSGLNVVTLPIPTKAIGPRAYMAMLHMLSDQERLPPTIIMRGNGESTLTFYSE